VSEREPERLFVYGTLRPGDCRWELLEPYVSDSGIEDTVAGTLYDTGLDYPAAVFGGSTLIRGIHFGLSEGTREEALRELDIVEDTVDGLYRRVRVTTSAGIEVWAYEYGDGLELTVIPSGDWFARS
jgi:gamma-glutamylcyclotransferase (GGCT)/AIG2-like uncharacterized protein YtfP